MTDFDKAFGEIRDMYDMLLKRRPAMKERLDVHMAETAKAIEDIFQPLTDYADGKITFDEYQAVMNRRHEEDQERRRTFYAEELYGDNPTLELSCAECGRVHEWQLREHDDELPPIYFECEDVTGEDCRDEDNEDE